MWTASEIDRLKHLYDLIKKRDQLSVLQRLYDLYDTWQSATQTLPTQLSALQDQLTQLHIEYAQYDRAFKQYQERYAERAVYQKMADVLRLRVSVMEDIHTVMGGYQNWIYKERVLPMLCQHANRVVSILCGPDRPLIIESDYQSGQFNWLLRDGSCCPPIEKASGFQRFVCALGMRIALGRVGASGMKTRQLFLDEGFTACDADNLSKVPDFLHNLLTMYDSVMIVSHLDELKNCVDHSIEITRNFKEHTSNMQYGVALQPQQTVTMKKKRTGRPKTKSAN
jgi:hypothetical protein